MQGQQTKHVVSLMCWKPPFVFHPTTPLSSRHGSLTTHEVHHPRERLWNSFCFSWPHCQRLTTSLGSRRSRLPVNIRNTKFLAAGLHQRSRWRRWGTGTKPSWIFLNSLFSFHFCSNLFAFGGNLFMSGRIIFFCNCLQHQIPRSNPASQTARGKK